MEVLQEHILGIIQATFLVEMVMMKIILEMIQKMIIKNQEITIYKKKNIKYDISAILDALMNNNTLSSILDSISKNIWQMVA